MFTGLESPTLLLSGPDHAPAGTVLRFKCHAPPLHLIFPPAEIVWEVKNWKGDAMEFSLSKVASWLGR